MEHDLTVVSTSFCFHPEPLRSLEKLPRPRCCRAGILLSAATRSRRRLGPPLPLPARAPRSAGPPSGNLCLEYFGGLARHDHGKVDRDAWPLEQEPAVGPPAELPVVQEEYDHVHPVLVGVDVVGLLVEAPLVEPGLVRQADAALEDRMERPWG